MVYCKFCGKEIVNKNRKIYCDNNCYSAFYKKESKIPYHLGLNLPTGRVGAVSELLVCADLLRRGYDVYRAVSPASYADIMAYKSGHYFEIEVRTARYNKNGNLTYPITGVNQKVLILVTQSDQIIHYPKNLPGGPQIIPDQRSRIYQPKTPFRSLPVVEAVIDSTSK